MWNSATRRRLSSSVASTCNPLRRHRQQQQQRQQRQHGFNLKDISFDSLVALAIPIGCLSLLTEAYFRTNLSDADTPASCANSESSRILLEHHVRELEQHGLVVIPNAISQTILTAAQRDIAQQQQQQLVFEPSANDSDVRQDQITWVRDDPVSDHDMADHEHQQSKQQNSTRQNKDNKNNGLVQCIHLVRGIAHALEKHNYTGSHHHRVPKDCQLALYKGDESAQYHRHLDRCTTPLHELGLLSWLRASDYRGRTITIILYLNHADRPVEAGGLLRCWTVQQQQQPGGEDGEGSGNGNTVSSSLNESTSALLSSSSSPSSSASFMRDVQPIGGTLLIFQSDKIEHMVLPSSVDRYALTSWIDGRINVCS
mmetsp:Transcript_17975/g.23234  ORF Transcript_17975/g.23234 Transcript_17975/m.23234 type:complete len:370 (+) Transcript_17975:50-1159(+)